MVSLFKGIIIYLLVLIGLLINPKYIQASYVNVIGNDFLLDGNLWYPYGVYYIPVYFQQITDNSFFIDYRQEVIATDLARIKSQGFNTVSVFFPNTENENAYQNLNNFLDIAETNELKVLLSAYPCFVNELEYQPVMNPTNCRLLLNKIKDKSSIFSIEVTWEPKIGDQNNRRLYLSNNWEKWLINRYGSLQKINQVFNKSWTLGNIPAPNDQILCNIGIDETLAANYHRFVIENFTKLYWENMDFIKTVDNNHLISGRMLSNNDGWDYSCNWLPINPLSAASVFDFISTQFYTVNNNQIDKRALLTKQYLDNGKPIVITEYGKSIFDPTSGYLSSLLDEQKNYYELAINAVKNADINGMFSWLWVGKRPWSSDNQGYLEYSDYGIIDPNTTDKPGTADRPVVNIIKQNSPYKSTNLSQYSNTIYFDYFKYPNLVSVFEETMSALVDAPNSTIKLDGYQYNSTNVPKDCLVTNAIGPCAQKYLASVLELWTKNNSANWTKLNDGQSIDFIKGEPRYFIARITNTGSTPWLTSNPGQSSGWVRLGYSGITEGRVNINGTSIKPFTSAVTNEFSILINNSDQINGSINFQLVDEGVSWFGEKLGLNINYIINKPIPTGLDMVCDSCPANSATFSWNQTIGAQSYLVRIDKKQDLNPEWFNPPEDQALCVNSSNAALWDTNVVKINTPIIREGLYNSWQVEPSNTTTCEMSNNFTMAVASSFICLKCNDLTGDLNNDEKVNNLDLIYLLAHWENYHSNNITLLIKILNTWIP